MFLHADALEYQSNQKQLNIEVLFVTNLMCIRESSSANVYTCPHKNIFVHSHVSPTCTLCYFCTTFSWHCLLA